MPIPGQYKSKTQQNVYTSFFEIVKSQFAVKRNIAINNEALRII